MIVQNITQVIIRVGSDALWGHLARGVFTPQTGFEKKKNLYENILLFNFWPYSRVIYNCDILQNKF